MEHLFTLRSSERFNSQPVLWGHMPKLRSLRLGPYSRTASSDGLAPLKVLVLRNGKSTSLPQHFPSLMTLMLHSVKLGNAISGSVDFPTSLYII